MPHINYHRGETRTFVVRHGDTLRFPRRRKTSGMGKRYQVHLGYGLRDWCPCCQPAHPKSNVKFQKRMANRIERRNGDQLCWEQQGEED